MKLAKRLISPMLSRMKSHPGSAGGFLFSTFRGEHSPMTEQVHFAVSRDGKNWEELHGGSAALVSDVGERGMRDPFLVRRHDGAGFHVIATDLSINRNNDWTRAVRQGSRCIVIWDSPDLVTWFGPRLVQVAPHDAGCTWAPEVVYDAENGDYLVFWASTTARDGFQKHCIWSARTQDFRTFSEPTLFIEKPTTIIDTTIVHDGSVYVRFTKDEKFKAITMETAPRLAGPWSEVETFTLSKLVGYEGPQCYQIQQASEGKPAVWGLILDHYAKGLGYQPFTTSDLSSGRFEPAEGFHFPFHFRHGSVLPISGEELRRLETSYLRTRAPQS